MGDQDLERSARCAADEIYEVECALAHARATPHDAVCAAHDMFEYAVGTGLDSDDYMDEYVQYFSCMVVRSEVEVKIDPPDAYPPFQILIAKTLTGKTITLDITSSNTVADIKALVRDEGGVPVDLQRVLLNGNQLADDSTSESCGIHAGSVLHVRSGVRGGGRKVDVSRTLFICGASRCLDIDIEEQVTCISGRGTCRLYPMTNSDHRQCELTTSEAYHLLRQAEWLVVGSRKLRVRRWDPLKAKTDPKEKKPKKSGDESTTEADQPEQCPAPILTAASQSTASGHAMKTVIGRLHYNMNRMNHSLMLLESI